MSSLSTGPNTAGTNLLGDGLAETFAEEAGGYLEQIETLLRQLEKDPGRRSLLRRIWQLIHTVKGTAGILGLDEHSRLAHRMEDLLKALDQGVAELDRDTLGLLFSTTDTLTEVLTVSPASHDVSSRLSGALERFDAHLGDPVGRAPRKTSSRLVSPAVDPGASGDDSPDPATRPEGTENQRVPVHRLEELTRLAGEFGIRRSRLDVELGALDHLVAELRRGLSRWSRISRRLEEEYRARRPEVDGPPAPSRRQEPSEPAEFDVLEMDHYTELDVLSNELAEAMNDAETLGSELAQALRQLHEFQEGDTQLNSDFQDRVTRLRMVPFAELAGRLHRTVRMTAAQQSKRVRLKLTGESVELEKSVVDAIAEPLLHLLRNAVVHGVETPAVRRARGKTEDGEIHVDVLQEGPEIAVRVLDDGAGLDLESIRERAVELDLLAAGNAGTAPADELRGLIFVPGFSTVHEVSEAAGRGVGLDSLVQAVDRLQGTVEVDSTPGYGTVFVIHLPRSRTLTSALLVQARGETLALPLVSVVQVRWISGRDLSHDPEGATADFDGRALPWRDLGETLGLPPVRSTEPEKLAALEVRSRGGRIALGCERIEGIAEIVVQPLDQLFGKRLRGLSGAALVGSGRVVLVAHPNELLEPARSPIAVASRGRERRPQVLIVDDSLTARKYMSRLVESTGWDSEVAADGLDALETLQRLHTLPDVIVLDLEMPRMDGYELLAALRHGKRAWHNIPTVVVTSRAGDKHRRKALALGVREYLVKPYHEVELISAIRRAVRPAEVRPAEVRPAEVRPVEPPGAVS